MYKSIRFQLVNPMFALEGKNVIENDTLKPKKEGEKSVRLCIFGC